MFSGCFCMNSVGFLIKLLWFFGFNVASTGDSRDLFFSAILTVTNSAFVLRIVLTETLLILRMRMRKRKLRSVRMRMRMRSSLQTASSTGEEQGEKTRRSGSIRRLRLRESRSRKSIDWLFDTFSSYFSVRNASHLLSLSAGWIQTGWSRLDSTNWLCCCCCCCCCLPESDPNLNLRLYCQSVRLSVCLSVRKYVRTLVCLSVCPILLCFFLLFYKTVPSKTRVTKVWDGVCSSRLTNIIKKVVENSMKGSVGLSFVLSVRLPDPNAFPCSGRITE